VKTSAALAVAAAKLSVNVAVASAKTYFLMMAVPLNGVSFDLFAGANSFRRRQAPALSDQPHWR
jgi:hypothetical protein